MNSYRFSISFLSPTKITVGVDYSKGIIKDPDGRKNFHQIIIGFLFFFIALDIVDEKGEC